MSDFLQIDREGPIAIVTMNRPETRNALSDDDVASAFVACCEAMNSDLSVRVMILTGAGPAFSSGGNLKTIRDTMGSGLGEPSMSRYAYRDSIQRIPLALYNLEVPVIAAVNGPAYGAGNDLTCMCDIRIAGERAVFAESFVKLGLTPGDGGAWLLPRAVGRAKAAEMAFTGEAIDAQQALACGLVSRVVPADQLLPTARALADKIAANPGAVMRMTKRLLREGEHSTLESLLELSAGYQALAHKTADHREAVMAFVEKRKPRFQ